MRPAILLLAIAVLVATCGHLAYNEAHASGSECRNDETGEVRTFDGPCPNGWHPVGGWVQ